MSVKKRGAAARKQKPDASSGSVTRMEDGTVCIGLGCSVIRVVPGSKEVDIDLSRCSDDAKQAVVKAIAIEGRMTHYKVRREEPRK